MEIILGILFLVLSSADVEFIELEKLTQKFYIITKVLPTTNRVELINKKEFAKAALDKNFETFIIYVAALEVPTAIPIHFSKAYQVQDNPTLTVLQYDKTPIKIPAKYSDYVDVFSSDLAIELPKNIGINEYVIELINCKQPPYKPIYTLSLVELETLKTYIKTHLKTGFIRSFKSF